MPGLFGMPVTASVALVTVALVVVVAVSLPAGRRGLSAIVGAGLRWPGLIRSELRGAAPLRVDGSRDGAVGDTTPDIPVVTCGLPVVERRERA